MTPRRVRHHVPDAMLAASASGALPYPFAVVVDAHLTYCDECAEGYLAHLVAGGLVLETIAGVDVSDDLRSHVLKTTETPEQPQRAAGDLAPYPACVADLLDHRPPRWTSLGLGAKQSILWRGASGSLRLLSIPADQAVPDHGHRGLEMTLVLSGAFQDADGRFGPGDVEIADEALTHTPKADAGEPCICLAATDAPLRFQTLVPRILQPMLGI